MRTVASLLCKFVAILSFLRREKALNPYRFDANCDELTSVLGRFIVSRTHFTVCVATDTLANFRVAFAATNGRGARATSIAAKGLRTSFHGWRSSEKPLTCSADRVPIA